MTSSTLSQKIPVNQQDPEALKAWIKAQALELGFADCVIARPDAQEELPRLQEYLDRGYHADMHFLAENFISLDYYTRKIYTKWQIYR